MITGKCFWRNLFTTDWFILQILLEWPCLESISCHHYRIFFSEFLLPHSLQLSWIFPTTNNFYNSLYWRSHQVSLHMFCSWDHIVMQKRTCGSSNNLCKCCGSPSTLSTNTSTERKLYQSWSNHLVKSFWLEMNGGEFSKHQKKTSDINRYKRYVFTAGVSQVNSNTMNRIVEQWSELQVTKVLIVHILSSSYKFSNFRLSNEKKATQQRSHWSHCVANNFVPNKVCVNYGRM